MATADAVENKSETLSADQLTILDATKQRREARRESARNAHTAVDEQTSSAVRLAVSAERAGRQRWRRAE